MNTSGNFLFLNVTDLYVNAFFALLNESVGGKPQKIPVHITLRGPYKGKILKKQETFDTLKQDVLQISGIGLFSNNDESVVYFKVDSPHLRKVWRKKNFPITKYGFHPHITVYRGLEKSWAHQLKEFLQNESIRFLTEKFELYEHTYIQEEITRHQKKHNIYERIPSLYDGKYIKNDFAERLEELRKKHQACQQPRRLHERDIQTR